MSTHYTAKDKLEAVRLAKNGNISQVARQYDVTRSTLYKWIEKADNLSVEMTEAEKLLQKKSEAVKKEVAHVIENAQRKEVLLKEIGDLESRKHTMAHYVESTLMEVVDHLSTHPSLHEQAPKDLVVIMEKLNAVKKDLYNEPTVIIEYRNSWMEQVLRVLLSMQGKNFINEFVQKMSEIEEANVIS